MFSARTGTSRTKNNIGRQLCEVMDKAGIPNATPHRLRRTEATAINEVGGILSASELLDQSDPAITQERDIRRNVTVNLATAAIDELAL